MYYYYQLVKSIKYYIKLVFKTGINSKSNQYDIWNYYNQIQPKQIKNQIDLTKQIVMLIQTNNINIL